MKKLSVYLSILFLVSSSIGYAGLISGIGDVAQETIGAATGAAEAVVTAPAKPFEKRSKRMGERPYTTPEQQEQWREGEQETTRARRTGTLETRSYTPTKGSTVIQDDSE